GGRGGRAAGGFRTRRDGKGGFLRSSEALDSFGRAGAATTDAYIVWALSEAGRLKGLDAELAAQKQRGLESNDPYLVALAANTLLNVAAKDEATAAVVARLAKLQKDDGSFAGAREASPMAGGQALLGESTARGTLARTKAGRGGGLGKRVDWLNAHRGGSGQWNSTQATILGLKALTAYAQHARATAA